jgi:oligopeptide transport system permease protein
MSTATTAGSVPAITSKKAHGKSLQREAMERLLQNNVAVISACAIVIICLIGLMAPLLAPYPFDEQFLDRVLASPSMRHWLGTDSLGRDMLSRLIYGARISMAVGMITAMISLVIGTFYGAISGWFGGWTDGVMMRAVDILDSIPQIVLLILVKLVFESFDIIGNPELKALTSMLLALSVTSWVSLARVVRGQILQVKQMAYVESARAMGASSLRMVAQHIFPNILGPVIVLLTFQIPSNILAESFLSFLGLGLQPPYSSWGVLANDGWRSLESYPHLMISPGVAIFVAMLAFNLLGDGLRDAFDPQMRGR